MGGSVAHDLSLYTAAVLRWLLVGRRESAVPRCDFWLERGREGTKDAVVCGRENQIMDINKIVPVRLRQQRNGGRERLSYCSKISDFFSLHLWTAPQKLGTAS